MIYHTSESTDASYNSLSYTWGQLNFSESLFIVSDERNPSVAQCGHGLEIPITVNLDNALRRVRADAPNTLLWADAVCINQADDWERTSQVQIMGKIFSEAFCVLIWTGLDRADRWGTRCLEILARLVRGEVHTDDSFLFLDNTTRDDLHQQMPERKVLELNKQMKANSRIGRDSVDRPKGQERKHKPETDEPNVPYRGKNEEASYVPYQNTAKGQIISKHADDEDYSILGSFFQRPYFSRRWVIQEVSLAWNIAIYCDATVFSTDVAQAIFEVVELPNSD
jgi:hypothetical protein